jgi:SAM-dependent methyltransferase
MGNPSLARVAQKIAKATGGFTGGGTERFEEIGRFTLESLQYNGLTPKSRVLDLGCGTLRLGYWLIRFLEPDCYFGLEPAQKFVSAGLKYAVGRKLASAKRPRFHYSGNFDFSVFDVKFDYVVARSIFSHASADMVRAAMDSFCKTAAPGAVMLASYKPTKDIDGDVDEVNLGEKDNWSFRRFRPEFLYAMARERGLAADDFGEIVNGQIWLRLRNGTK